MELDYHNEAFIIAGATDNGKVLYYSFSIENGEHSWETCAFYANFYNSLDEAHSFMRDIQEDKDNHKHIKKIWVEKISTSKVQGESEIIL